MEREEIISLYRTGMGLQPISQKTGHSYQRIKKIIHQEGIMREQGGKGNTKKKIVFMNLMKEYLRDGKTCTAAQAAQYFNENYNYSQYSVSASTVAHYFRHYKDMISLAENQTGKAFIYQLKEEEGV